MKKFFFTIIILTLLLITSVFAVFNSLKEDNEVVFWTLQMSDFAPYINDVIAKFEMQYPGIKIKWVDIPFSEGEKRTLAAVLSDNPPDLVNLNPDFSNILARKGALYEIQNGNTRQFKWEILQALKIDDHLYSIPWYATSAVTIYNKSFFKDELPKTYADLKTIAPFVKKNSDAYIWLPNITENDTMLKILNKFGVSNASDINSDKAVEVFDLFNWLYSNKYIPKETVTMTLQESLEKYMSGSIAMINAGANFLNMIRENSPDIYKNTDVAPQLVGDLGQNDFSLMNFVIPARAKHKKEALKFVLFLTNDENQYELAKMTNVLAVNSRTLRRNFYTDYYEGDLIGKARVISAKQLDNLDPVFISKRNQKEINNLVNSAVQEILLSKKSSKDVLSRVAKNWKKLEEE